jgi:hypothetical protein
MPWSVTLIVNDCATSAPMAGAMITDGYYVGYTDSYGQFIAVIADEYQQYIVQIKKSGYTSRYFTFSRTPQQTSTPQTTCLNEYVPPPSTGGGSDCFIVTAATGSEQSREVMELRALRDRIAAASALAGGLIEAIYKQYWLFSPSIAERIRESDTLRVGVTMLAVRPLFAWYRLAAQLALDPRDTAAISALEAEVMAACPGYVSPAKIARYLSMIHEGEPLPASAPGIAGDLGPRLREALTLPLARWAIFDPLVRTWCCAAKGLNVRSEVAQWLACAPVDVLAPPPAETMERDVAALSSLLSFDPAASKQLGSRLNTAWPAATTALRKAGMLNGTA